MIKKIIWIDKSNDIIESYIDALQIDSLATFIQCCDFEVAEEIISSRKDIDAVITNYCTFFWHERLIRENYKMSPNVFDFLEKVIYKNQTIHFFLFSSIANSYEQIDKYKALKNFYFINKNSGQLLRKKLQILIFENKS